jgi:tripartite-type tricarboxylate transporter receptor subunit TctC
VKTNELRAPLTAAATLCAVVFLFSTPAYPQAPFYQGKTITILHGRAPGGSGDYRVRAVLPFLQKYIPGNPTFVHEYMDGGGGRKAANHIFAMTRTDGLVIGNVGGGVVANAVLGESGVQYDLDKLPFIGSPYSATHYVFATRRELGLTNLDKLRAASGIRIGAQSVGHTNYTIGRIFAALLGLKDSKYVTGYSIPERDVALLRGEIDAIANTDDFYARNPEWIEKKLVDFHVVMEIPKGLKHRSFRISPTSRPSPKPSAAARCFLYSVFSACPAPRSFCLRRPRRIEPR